MSLRSGKLLKHGLEDLEKHQRSGENQAIINNNNNNNNNNDLIMIMTMIIIIIIYKLQKFVTFLTPRIGQNPQTLLRS